MIFGSRNKCQRASPPTVNRVPPDDLEPLLKRGFCPLAMTPPHSAKKPVIFRCSRRPMVLRQTMNKNGVGPSRMPVTGNQEYACRVERLKTPGNKSGFSESGVLFKRTDAYLRGHLFGIPLEKCFCVLGRRVTEIAGIRRSVKKQMFPIPGTQELHATTVTRI